SAGRGRRGDRRQRAAEEAAEPRHLSAETDEGRHRLARRDRKHVADDQDPASVVHELDEIAAAFDVVERELPVIAGDRGRLQMSRDHVAEPHVRLLYGLVLGRPRADENRRRRARRGVRRTPIRAVPRGSRDRETCKHRYDGQGPPEADGHAAVTRSDDTRAPPGRQGGTPRLTNLGVGAADTLTRSTWPSVWIRSSRQARTPSFASSTDNPCC